MDPKDKMDPLEISELRDHKAQLENQESLEML